MGIRDWLYHRHYWGIPHRREGDNQIIQICYECGRERQISMELTRQEDDDKRQEQGDLSAKEA
jgi:hypothetical protein